MEDDFPDFNWVILRFQPLIFRGVNHHRSAEICLWERAFFRRLLSKKLNSCITHLEDSGGVFC